MTTAAVRKSKPALTAPRPTLPWLRLQWPLVSHWQSQSVGTSVQATNAQSLQDQSSYHSNSASMGGSVTVGSAPSASASLSKTRVDSDFQSVGTQSGIRAGDGGFTVNV